MNWLLIALAVVILWPVAARLYHATYGSVEEGWEGFRIEPGSQRLIFDGLAIFGDLYPRIWVDTLPCYNDGDIADEIDHVNGQQAYQRRALVFELLGHGTAICLGKVIRR